MRNLIPPQKKVREEHQLAMRDRQDIAHFEPKPVSNYHIIPPQALFFMPKSGVVTVCDYRLGKECGGMLVAEAILKAVVS